MSHRRFRQKAGGPGSVFAERGRNRQASTPQAFRSWGRMATSTDGECRLRTRQDDVSQPADQLLQARFPHADAGDKKFNSRLVAPI
jgi:hypothetical protein